MTPQATPAACERSILDLYDDVSPASSFSPADSAEAALAPDGSKVRHLLPPTLALARPTICTAGVIRLWPHLPMLLTIKRRPRPAARRGARDVLLSLFFLRALLNYLTTLSRAAGGIKATYGSSVQTSRRSRRVSRAATLAVGASALPVGKQLYVRPHIRAAHTDTTAQTTKKGFGR